MALTIGAENTEDSAARLSSSVISCMFEVCRNAFCTAYCNSTHMHVQCTCIVSSLPSGHVDQCPGQRGVLVSGVNLH